MSRSRCSRPQRREHRPIRSLLHKTNALLDVEAIIDSVGIVLVQRQRCGYRYWVDRQSDVQRQLGFCAVKPLEVHGRLSIMSEVRAFPQGNAAAHRSELGFSRGDSRGVALGIAAAQTGANAA